jgi:hypothetical protein
MMGDARRLALVAHESFVTYRPHENHPDFFFSGAGL